MHQLLKMVSILVLFYGYTADAKAVQQCPLSCVGQPPIIEKERQKEIFVDAKAYEVYTETQLLNYIRRGTYLQRVRKDQCQIVDDIRANALTLKLPTFQYLWAEMLIHGTCVPKNVSHGLHWLRSAVRQGFAEAMLKLARYYKSGSIVIPNYKKSARLAFTAAQGGNIPSRIFLVELILDGHGSSMDYAKAYDWLYHSSFQSKSDQIKSQRLLAQLANLLSPSSVYEIQSRPNDEF